MTRKPSAIGFASIESCCNREISYKVTGRIGFEDVNAGVLHAKGHEARCPRYALSLPVRVGLEASGLRRDHSTNVPHCRSESRVIRGAGKGPAMTGKVIISDI
jgi:hypothetical protein